MSSDQSLPHPTQPKSPTTVPFAEIGIAAEGLTETSIFSCCTDSLKFCGNACTYSKTTIGCAPLKTDRPSHMSPRKPKPKPHMAETLAMRMGNRLGVLNAVKMWNPFPQAGQSKGILWLGWGDLYIHVNRNKTESFSANRTNQNNWCDQNNWCALSACLCPRMSEHKPRNLKKIAATNLKMMQ